MERIIGIIEKKEMLRIKQCLHDFFEEDSDANPIALKDKMQKILNKEISDGFNNFLMLCGLDRFNILACAASV